MIYSLGNFVEYNGKVCKVIGIGDFEGFGEYNVEGFSLIEFSTGITHVLGIDEKEYITPFYFSNDWHEILRMDVLEFTKAEKEVLTKLIYVHDVQNFIKVVRPEHEFNTKL